MKALTRFWLSGLLGLCAVLTLALLFWPVGVAVPATASTAERYLGADHSARNGGRVARFALRLQAVGADEAAPAAVEALPILVGLAGRRAYLRAPDTGEIEGVSIGQALGGWRLVAVTARTATVRGTGGDRRLELFSVATAPPAPTATPTAIASPSPENAATSLPQGG